MDQNCAYCMEGELSAKFGIKICELETSKIYLFKEQSHKGRVIVAHKKHVGDMNELTAEERGAYFEEVARVASISPGQSQLRRIWRHRTPSAFSSGT